MGDWTIWLVALAWFIFGWNSRHLLDKRQRQYRAMETNRNQWREVAQLWSGAYSAQTYTHGLEEIETANMARKAEQKATHRG